MAPTAKLDQVELVHSLFRDFFVSNQIFCEQVVALSIDPAAAGVTVTFSKRLPHAEVQGEIQDIPRGFEIVSFIPLDGVTLVETTSPIPPVSDLYPFMDDLLCSIWETLPWVLNLKRGHENPFYLAGNARKLCCQYYLLGSNRFFPIYVQNSEPGVTSIRLDSANNRLIGIRVNERGLGTAIVQFPAGVARSKPHKLDNLKYWKEVEVFPKPILHSFSKPNSQGQLVVNYQTGMLESVFFADKATPPTHSPTVPSPTRVVGTLSPGTDTYLEYKPVTGLTQVRNVRIDSSTPQPLSDLTR